MNIHAYVDNSTLQRQVVTNMRTFERIIPSQPLQPYLDSRPSSTKYSLLPIVDPRKDANVPLVQRATYNPETIYYPGNDTAPWAGYATNVNNESILRNQVYALQKCDQSVYIPSSKSTLYNDKFKNSYPVNQPHEGLFKTEQFATTSHNNKDQIGYAMFNNSTRNQLRNLTK